MDTIDDLISLINPYIDNSSLGIRKAYINLRTNKENRILSPALLADALLVMTKQTKADEIELGARVAVKACQEIENLDRLVRLQVAYHLAYIHAPATELEIIDRGNAPAGVYLQPIIREVAERSAILLDNLLSRGDFHKTHPKIALKCHQAIVQVFGGKSDAGRKAMQGMFNIIKDPNTGIDHLVIRLGLQFLEQNVERYSNLDLDMRAWAAEAIGSGIRGNGNGATMQTPAPSGAVISLNAFRLNNPRPGNTAPQSLSGEM